MASALDAIKAAMLAVKPQPKRDSGPPAAKVIRKPQGSPGPFRFSKTAQMPTAADNGGGDPYSGSRMMKGPAAPGGPTGGSPGGPGGWIQGLFQGGGGGAKPPLTGQAGRDLQIAQGGSAPPPPPQPAPQPPPPSPQQFGAGMARRQASPYIQNAQRQIALGEEHDAAQPAAESDMYAGLAPDESAFFQQQAETPPPPAPPPSPYAGLAPDEDAFIQSQGDLSPPPAPAPPTVPEVPAAPTTPGLARLPDAPPGRFSHIIDDTQRMVDSNRQRLAAGNLPPARAAQIERGIAAAERRIQDLTQRQGFGQDEYKGYLGGQGVKNPDAAAERIFQPGGQMDWYQNAANNAAAGKPEYAGMSSQSPELAAALAEPPPPPGKTEMLAKAGEFVERLFPKTANMYGRTDSTLPKMKQTKPRTITRDRFRFRQKLRLPLPNEPEKAAAAKFMSPAEFVGSLRKEATSASCGHMPVQQSSRRMHKVKRADAEDALLHRMTSKGKLSKGSAIAIAKSKGWIRQSGRHLELNKAGRGPRNNAAKHIREEAKSAAATFVAGLFAN